MQILSVSKVSNIIEPLLCNSRLTSCSWSYMQNGQHVYSMGINENMEDEGLLGKGCHIRIDQNSLYLIEMDQRYRDYVADEISSFFNIKNNAGDTKSSISITTTFEIKK